MSLLTCTPAHAQRNNQFTFITSKLANEHSRRCIRQSTYAEFLRSTQHILSASSGALCIRVYCIKAHARIHTRIRVHVHKRRHVHVLKRYKRIHLHSSENLWTCWAQEAWKSRRLANPAGNPAASLVPCLRCFNVSAPTQKIIYTYILIHIRICIHIYPKFGWLHIYMYMYMYMYIYIYIYTYIYTFGCIQTYTYICIYLTLHYTFEHTHIFPQFGYVHMYLRERDRDDILHKTRTSQKETKALILLKTLVVKSTKDTSSKDTHQPEGNESPHIWYALAGEHQPPSTPEHPMDSHHVKTPPPAVEGVCVCVCVCLSVSVW